MRTRLQRVQSYEIRKLIAKIGEVLACPVCGSWAVTIHQEGRPSQFRPACGCES